MRCRGLHGRANPVYLSRLLFSDLQSVAPYCVPGGITLISISPFLRHCKGWEPEDQEYGLLHLCPLCERVNIEEKQGFRRTQSAGPLGRAASVALSVHYLGSEVAGIEVRHEATNLSALYLQDAQSGAPQGDHRLKQILLLPRLRRGRLKVAEGRPLPRDLHVPHHVAARFVAIYDAEDLAQKLLRRDGLAVLRHHRQVEILDHFVGQVIPLVALS